MEKRLHNFSRTSWLLLCLFLVALAASAQDEVTPQNGDVNSDSEVNIADVNAVIDIILDGGTYDAAADVNHDGEINIADVNSVIGLVLDEHVMTFTVGDVSFSMVEVEGGTFQSIHSPQVTLSPFAIGQTEVTQALWVAVMGSNPSYFNGDDRPGGPDNPVEQVSWDDCQEFIAKLNEMTGKTFRLPSEAEWEFAARGGNYSHGYTYAGSNDKDEVAWHRNNSGHRTHSVAELLPNELGLYDMSGGVCEWCQDWFGPYGSEALVNPVGPESGTERVIRGGSYYWTDPTYCRVSCRMGSDPAPENYNNNYPIGLRLVMDVDPSAP